LLYIDKILSSFLEKLIKKGQISDKNVLNYEVDKILKTTTLNVVEEKYWIKLYSIIIIQINQNRNDTGGFQIAGTKNPIFG
jgi:hypothetical protein